MNTYRNRLAALAPALCALLAVAAFIAFGYALDAATPACGNVLDYGIFADTCTITTTN